MEDRPFVTRLLVPMHRFMSGWGFPTFLLTALAVATLLVVAVLVVPPEVTPLERFVTDFKVWCFNYDPESGSMEWAYVGTMLSSPLMIGIFALMIWWAPLRDAVHEGPRQLWRAALPAVVLVGALAVGLFYVGRGRVTQDEFAFPAEGLRTHDEPPVIDLVDHDGQRIQLSSLRGSVVIVTGVYATCGYTCPMILAQARRLVDGVESEARRDVSVLAITLDPERDDPAALAAMARAQGVSSPLFHLLTGAPEDVNPVLDALGIARRRDPGTGVIDHANLFIIVDRQGQIAYRFTLGEQQERWSRQALALLLAEGGGGVGEPARGLATVSP